MAKAFRRRSDGFRLVVWLTLLSFVPASTNIGYLFPRAYAQPAGESAADQLEHADFLQAAGEHVDAALLYFHVTDHFAEAPESVTAYERINEISLQFMEGRYTESEIRAFEDGIPDWTDCKSAKGKYLLLGLVWTRAKVALAVEQKEVADRYNRLLMHFVRADRGTP